MQIVLERRSCYEKPVTRLELSHNFGELKHEARHDRDLALLVFDSMCFVDDDVLPDKLLESALRFQNHLIRSHDNIELPRE